MSKDGIYKMLVCPWCKNSLNIIDIEGRPTKPRYGLLECPCRTYPIVSGIPVLRDDALTNLAKRKIQNHQFEAAKCLLLNRTRSIFPGKDLVGELASKVRSLPTLIELYLMGTTRAEASKLYKPLPDTFTSAVRSLDQGRNFVEYLIYRTFEHSFWNLHATLDRIASSGSPVLDYGGGWGHSSRVIREITGCEVYNLEINFRSIYFHSQYLNGENPDVVGAVIEPGSDIPFNSDSFGTVLDLDGFHYVENKYGMASEYERVTRPAGQILLLHTHNKDITNKGEALSPQEYAQCFSWTAKIAPEIEFLNEFLGSKRAEDSLEWSGQPQEVNLFITKSGENNITTEKNSLLSYEGPLAINPIYNLQNNDNTQRLVRQDAPPEFKEEFEYSYKSTKKEYTIDSNSIPELLCTGILSPLPTSYSDGINVGQQK